jgi:hypothetical protein
MTAGFSPASRGDPARGTSSERDAKLLQTTTFCRRLRCWKGHRSSRRAILARHCRVGKIRRTYSKFVKKGRVISEMPRPRMVLPNRGKVNVIVSRGRKR